MRLRFLILLCGSSDSLVFYRKFLIFLNFY